MVQISDFEQLFNTMLQLGKLMSQHTQETHEERSATILQFSALNFIREHSDSTVSELSESLQLSKSSATQLVERLVKLTLADRINDKEDRRIIRLSITKAGEKQLSTLKDKLLERMQKIFSKIPAKDTRELIRIHTTLIEALKRENNK
jgi:DNA-binding MarR family transcriptional regulator